MNVNNALYSLSPNDEAATRSEQETAARPPASRAACQPRSLWQDPALYVTVFVAVALVTLLDMAVRMQ